MSLDFCFFPGDFSDSLRILRNVSGSNNSVFSRVKTPLIHYLIRKKKQRFEVIMKSGARH
eukprot:COSAG02_NODE_3774_length_6252_cov_6.836340_3_plen_60_part_00